MSRFERFIGVWNTTGDVLETDDAPAGNLLATDTYRWLPGKRFVVHDVDAHFDGKPTRSMEVIGYDIARKTHFARSFDDRGAMDVFEVALEGRHWTIDGKSVRFRGSFDARWNTLAGLWETKRQRGGWQPWIRLQLNRA